jgi:CBS-domain-containing membrane protein
VVNSVLIRFNFYCFNAIDHYILRRATALIAVTGSEEIKNMGYWYVITPVLSGVLILLIVALIFNNMTSDRYYPSHPKYHKFRKRYTILLKTNDSILK